MVRKILFLFPILVLIGTVGVGYVQYNEQREDVLMRIDDIGFEFGGGVLGDEGILDLRIKGYSDVMFVTIPLRVDNPGDADLYLERVGFRMSLAGVPLEERVIEDLEVPAGGSKTLTLKDVRITAEKLDDILPRARMDAARPEDATMRLAVEVYVSYPFELGPLRTLRPKIRHARLGGDVYLRSIMGGKTKEEAAKEFL